MDPSVFETRLVNLEFSISTGNLHFFLNFILSLFLHFNGNSADSDETSRFVVSDLVTAKVCFVGHHA